MENVFSSAYCTLAAVSGEDSSHGFLARELECRHVTIDDGNGHHIYVSRDLYDFDEDVEKAILNTRGWVLQERVLSRRTIHFSANHIYWECGEGISCESLLALNRRVFKTYMAGLYNSDTLRVLVTMTAVCYKTQISRH